MSSRDRHITALQNKRRKCKRKSVQKPSVPPPQSSHVLCQFDANPHGCWTEYVIGLHPACNKQWTASTWFHSWLFCNNRFILAKRIVPPLFKQGQPTCRSTTRTTADLWCAAIHWSNLAGTLAFLHKNLKHVVWNMMTYEPRTSTAQAVAKSHPHLLHPCLCKPGVCVECYKPQNVTSSTKIFWKKHWGRWRLEPGLRVRHGSLQSWQAIAGNTTYG